MMPFVHVVSRVHEICNKIVLKTVFTYKAEL